MRAKEFILVAVAALALAAIWTLPLVLDPLGSMPHDPRFAPFSGSDMNLWAWDFWWAREVVESGKDPFFSDWIYPPSGHSLALNTHIFLWSLFSVPLQWLAGPVFAINAMALLLLASAATAAWFLGRELRMGIAGCLVLAFGFGFSPYFLQKGLVHFNLGASPWLPLMAIFLLRWMRADPHPTGRMQAWRAALGAGCVLGLCLLTGSLQSVYLCAFAALLWLVAPATDPNRSSARRRGLLAPGPLLVALTSSLLIAMPFLSAWVAEWQAMGGAGQFEPLYHPRLIDFLRPSGLHPLFAGDGAAAAIASAEFEGKRPELAAISLAWSLLFLGLVGVLLDVSARRWALLFGLLFLLAWDPGPQPQGWLSSIYRHIPPLGLLRISARFLPAAILALAVVAGRGADRLWERPRLKPACWLLFLGLGFECLVVGYPSAKVQFPEAVERIAKLDEQVGDELALRPGSVLTLPPQAVQGACASMLWQTKHERPVVVSYVARINTAKLQILALAGPSLIRWALNGREPDPRALALDLDHLDVDHVLVRNEDLLDPEQLHRLLDQLEGWERVPVADDVAWWCRIDRE